MIFRRSSEVRPGCSHTFEDQPEETTLSFTEPDHSLTEIITAYAGRPWHEQARELLSKKTWPETQNKWHQLAGGVQIYFTRIDTYNYEMKIRFP